LAYTCPLFLEEIPEFQRHGSDMLLQEFKDVRRQPQCAGDDFPE